MSREQSFFDIISGRRRGATAAMVRALLAAAEPGYAGMMRLRNILYDGKILGITALSRPTISVGNITTGGTGKTPLVCWLASALRDAGRRPAVLMRGYKSGGGKSDEAMLIEQAAPQTPVAADPDRVRAARRTLAAHADIDLFILDDGMQHRRVARDVELVLVSAVKPWGFGHVLPRGLLREPLGGLRRADAIILTHCDRVDAPQLEQIEKTAHKYNGQAPIFHARHELVGLVTSGGEEMPMTALADRSFFVACGIGQPENFVAALKSHGPQCVGSRFFADHHAFGNEDIVELRQQAVSAGASAIVVTEKDWTKLRAFSSGCEPGVPFWRAKMTMTFAGDDGAKLLELIRRTMK